MIKPILKIEVPQGLGQGDADKIGQSLKGSPIEEDYHIIIVTGTSDYFSIEIITASDIALHKRHETKI